VITKGGLALSPRDEAFTAENIKPTLNMRDFMEIMRSSGIQTGDPPPLNQTDRPKSLPINSLNPSVFHNYLPRHTSLDRLIFLQKTFWHSQFLSPLLYATAYLT